MIMIIFVYIFIYISNIFIFVLFIFKFNFISYFFILLLPGADHGRKVKVELQFKIADEDSHSTDLSVSGEESHWTI